MPLTVQQLRERLGASPGAIGICPDDGRLVYLSQQVGTHFVPGGPELRARYRAAPHKAPGAIHCSHIVYRSQLGLPQT